MGMIEMNDKLIKAINSWENDYLNCTDDELSIIVNAASSTLTPPQSDTQGALADAFIKMANLEKENERLRDECYKRQSWLDKAKSDAGYDRNVSFDVVWKDALQALTRPSREAKLLGALKQARYFIASPDLSSATGRTLFNVNLSNVISYAEAEGE
jgi:hypothetical protein